AVVVQAAQVWSGMGPKLRKEISRGGLIFCGEDEQWSGGIQLELRESNLECGAHEFKVLKHMLRLVDIAIGNQAKVGAADFRPRPVFRQQGRAGEQEADKQSKCTRNSHAEHLALN